MLMTWTVMHWCVNIVQEQMTEFKFVHTMKALLGGVNLCAVTYHMSSSISPNSKGEKIAMTLAALSTGTWPFCGALDDGMGEVFVSARTNTKDLMNTFLWTLYILGQLVFLCIACVGLFGHKMNNIPKGQNIQYIVLTNGVLKISHHNEKKQTERKTERGAKSILICKHNQYETCQGIYEVKKTKQTNKTKKISRHEERKDKKLIWSQN